jgi:hypothetical protein
LFVVIYLLGRKQRTGSYMVVARMDADCAAEEQLAKLPGYQMKNKTVSAQMTEVVAEIRLGEKEMDAISQMRNLPGIGSVAANNIIATLKTVGVYLK